jgi:phospholipid/cholesterol/gamma-HCH transport system ATP-binding protein
LILRFSPAKYLSSWGRAAAAKACCSNTSSDSKSPDAGEILINGESIQTPEIASKYRLALVFQSGALFSSLTVGENVGLYLSEHRLKPPAEIARIVAEKLEDVGLKGTEDKMPRRTFRRHEKAGRHRPRARH